MLSDRAGPAARATMVVDVQAEETVVWPSRAGGMQALAVAMPAPAVAMRALAAATPGRAAATRVVAVSAQAERRLLEQPRKRKTPPEIAPSRVVRVKIARPPAAPCRVPTSRLRAAEP